MKQTINPEKTITVNQVNTIIDGYYSNCHGGVMDDFELIVKLKTNGKIALEGWLNMQNNKPIHLFTEVFKVEHNLVA